MEFLVISQCFYREHSEKPDKTQKSPFEGSRELLRELEGLKFQRERQSHRDELISAAPFTLGTFADSSCGQQAESPGFAPAEELLPGDRESIWQK